MPDRPREPLSLPSHVRFGRYAPALGRLLLPMFSRRVAGLCSGTQPGPLSYLDRLLIASLVSRHKAEGTLDQLSALSERYWAGDGATEYHARVESRFRSVFLPHHAVIVPRIERAVAATGRKFSTLCEIGSGSGQVVNYVSEQLRCVERFVGIDLSPAQIARNRARFDRAQLSFESGDAVAWITAHAQPGWIYLTSGGVLEYFARAKLLGLLSMLANEFHPSLLAIVEPLAPGHDLASQADSFVFGCENTFSHNYPYLCDTAGLEVLDQEEIAVDGQRWLLLIARSGPGLVRFRGSEPAQATSLRPAP